MNLKTFKNNFRYVLDKMIKRVQKNPKSYLNLIKNLRER